MSITHAPPASLPNRQYVRTLPGVTLVGVVHDHPASVARVRSVIETTDHATLALELPPLAIGLFEEYAADPRETPAFGGEMSAAIAASDARVVGIDGPSRRFLRALVRHVAHDRPRRGELSRLLSATTRAVRHALSCRLAGSLARRTGIRVEVGSPRTYDCTPAGSLAEQADHERTQVSRARSVLRAFPSPELARRDAVREDCMATSIANAREAGPVVAVVGIDHLDGLAARLRS
ncbi:TraB/GumN family protein [Halalkalicoccus ordinarius]|uniref:hypothetical protein n=1 Tax=Halalkalicoccus ordinarius TaxID=3116651 RepID=UPI00300F352A